MNYCFKGLRGKLTFPLLFQPYHSFSCKMLKRKYSGAYSNSNKRRVGTFGNVLNAAYRLGRLYYNSRTKTKYNYGGQGITSQYDKKTVYRKKTMPRKKKRRWVGFVKKVNAVLLKDVGTKTIIRNTQLTRTWADDQQIVSAAILFGKDGGPDTSTSCGHDDLKQIFANDNELIDATAKAHFISGVMDLTFTNMSEVEEGNNNSGMEVDIYELIFMKHADAPTLVGGMIGTASTNTGPINPAIGQITINTRGATPFDLPDFLAQGVSVLKKTKFFLGRGQVATYQYRDPKNFQIRRDRVDDADENFILPYKTRGILIVSKGIPTGDATKVLKVLQVGVTRKYGYKVIGTNTDTDNVLP